MSNALQFLILTTAGWLNLLDRFCHRCEEVLASGLTHLILS